MCAAKPKRLTTPITPYVQLLLIVITSFYFSPKIEAQPIVEWSKVLGGTLNDIPHAVRNTSDGGFVIAGQSNSADFNVGNNKGGFDLWVTRLDVAGNLVWEKNFGGSADDYALDLQLTADGGFVMIGGTGSDDGDLDENNGGIDVWVLKIDSLGEQEWSKNFGGTGIDVGTSICVVSDGYVMTGCTGSAGEPGIAAGYGSNEYWVIKVDLDGELVWENTYGGKRHDAAKEIISTTDGGFIVAGNTWSTDGEVENNNGHSDAWVIKIDEVGALQWSKNFGGNTPDRLNDLVETIDGNYALVGAISEMNFVGTGIGGRLDEQFWLLKFSSTGEELWSTTFGGEKYDEATSVEATLDGGFLVGGWTRSFDGEFSGYAGNKDAWMVKTDSLGAKEWSKLYGGAENEVIQSVIQTNDGGYMMLGFSNSNLVDTLFSTTGFEDWWTVKFGGNAVNVDIGNDLTVCVDEEFTLDAYLPNCDCTYLWSDGNTDSIRQISLSTTGPVSVTVTDQDGLEGVDVIDVFVSEPIVTLDLQNNPCNGFPSGIIELTPEGDNYSYEWEDGSTGSSISNLVAGTYTYTVTDGNNCSIIDEVEITEPQPISIIENITEVDCYENSTGSIDLTLEGGTGGFEYEWASGETTQDIFGLTTGGYTVTIIDANGCIKVQDWVVNQPTNIDIGTSLIPATCFDSEDGGVEINANGGVGDFTYEWSNGDEVENLINVSSGTYTLIVTDGNNCTNTAAVTIPSPDEIIINATVENASCSGNNDGSITTNISGGEGLFQFQWSNDETGSNLSQLSSGTYTLTVTDGNNCEKIKEIVVSQNTNISITAQTTMPTCFGENDGSIDVSINGGTGEFTYLWNNQEQVEDLNALPSGDYIITVTDDNGCEAIELFSLVGFDSIEITSTIESVSCNGGADGMIMTEVIGGSGGFDFFWSNGVEASMVEALPANDYTLVVTDSEGCSQLELFTVSEPDPIELINIDLIEPSCFGDFDGQINFEIEGGTSPYTIESSGDGNSNLPSGNYTFTITDANNCEYIKDILLPEPASLNATFQITNPSMGDNGAITTTVEGGTPPYDFDWNDGAYNGANISNLSGGIYELILTDANDCVFVEVIALESTSLFEIENLQTFEIFPNPNDGTFFLKLEFQERENIDIIITNELGQVIQYLQRNDNFILEKNTLSDIPSGMYFVQVKTKNGVAIKRIITQK